MTDKIYQELKQDHVKHVLKMVEKTGSVYPHITIICERDGEEKPTVIHIPIPGEFMQNDETKEQLVEQVFPEIKEELKKKKFTVVAICFASEIWIRESSPEEYKEIEDYHDIPVNDEGIIISIEDEKENTTYCYKIVKESMSVGEEGLNGKVRVEEFHKPIIIPQGTGNGRFANLYSEFV